MTTAHRACRDVRRVQAPSARLRRHLRPSSDHAVVQSVPSAIALVVPRGCADERQHHGARAPGRRVLRGHRRGGRAHHRACPTSGGTAHEEGLRVLVEDLASPEAGLTPRGNYFQRSEVKSALVGVLLTQAQFAAHPEHRDVPIERPIFLMGLPRTGTTALHRYLHADPTAQGLEMWLTQYPQPRPPRETWEQDPIFNAMQQAFTAHHVETPGLHGHPLHGCDHGRGVLAAAAPDRQVQLLRVAGQPAALLASGCRARTGPTPTRGTSRTSSWSGSTTPRSAGCSRTPRT